ANRLDREGLAAGYFGERNGQQAAEQPGIGTALALEARPVVDRRGSHRQAPWRRCPSRMEGAASVRWLHLGVRKAELPRLGPVSGPLPAPAPQSPARGTPDRPGR